MVSSTVFRGWRISMACAVASFAALIGLEPSGIIQTARLAWGSVGPTVVTDESLESFLTGKKMSREIIGVVAEKIRQAVGPLTTSARRRITGGKFQATCFTACR